MFLWHTNGPIRVLVIIAQDLQEQIAIQRQTDTVVMAGYAVKVSQNARDATARAANGT